MNDLELVLLHKLRGLFTPHERSMLKALTENPENHNGIYRGKDLSNVYTVEQIYERVHDGSFEDLYLGDHFTVNITTDLYTRFTGSAFESGVTYYEMGGTVIARTWTETQDAEPQEGKVYCTKQVVNENVDLMIAHFDYYMNAGYNSRLTNHHLVLIPRRGFLNTAPFDLNEQHMAYVELDIHQITLPCYAASIKTALNNHLTTFSGRLPSAVDLNIPSMSGSGALGATTATIAADWDLQMMTENQVYGSCIMASSWRDICYEGSKFAVFEFMNLRPSGSPNIGLRTFSYYKENGGHIMYETIASGGTVGGSATINEKEIIPIMIFG